MLTWTTTLLAAGTLVGLAVVAAIVLGWANTAFHVKVDPRVEAVVNVLPGANCGGCGYVGCRQYAEAVAKAAGATWLDDVIGALTGKLEELGIAENTVLIYFNDNGMETHAKGSCYEGGINIPVMVRWPGTIEPRTRTEFISNVDFVPTILDLCRAEAPEDMQLDGSRNLAAAAREIGMDMETARDVALKLFELKIIVQTGGGGEAVSEGFMAFLTRQFSLAVGPLAEILIEDQIEDLGESRDSFPGSRIPELVDLLARQIPRQEKKIDFQQVMLDYMRN